MREYLSGGVLPDFIVVIHRDICREQSGGATSVITEAANSLSAAAGPELSTTRNHIANLRIRPRQDSLGFGFLCSGAPVPQYGERRQNDDCIAPRLVRE